MGCTLHLQKEVKEWKIYEITIIIQKIVKKWSGLNKPPTNLHEVVKENKHKRSNKKT
jgi:hypothetical protein